VLERMIDVLLFYVKQGATILRLDAIAYLWKEIGTNCIHLSQTHDMVKLFRSILDLVAPDVMIITETNVPHLENISYFGDGWDEVQMVYNRQKQIARRIHIVEWGIYEYT
jgi:sucrose phosphorylase